MMYMMYMDLQECQIRQHNEQFWMVSVMNIDLAFTVLEHKLQKGK
jgi:hypothetical protein